MALYLPKLKREKWLLRPTRRKMAARLRGDVADLRTWLEMQLPLWQYKPSVDPAQARKDATTYVNLKIGQLGCWVDIPAVSIAATELQKHIRVWQHPVSLRGIDGTTLSLVDRRGDSSHDHLNLYFHEKYYEPLVAIEGVDLASDGDVMFDERMKPAKTIGFGDCFFHSLLYLIDHEDYIALNKKRKRIAVGALRERIRARGVELVKADSDLAADAQRCLQDEYKLEFTPLREKIWNGRWDQISVS